MRRRRRAQNVRESTPSAGAAGLSRRRTHQRATPVMDPGLEGFLRELGYLAAEAVLQNLRKTGGLPGGSTNSPGGPDRNPVLMGEGTAGVGPVAPEVPDASSGSQTTDLGLPQHLPLGPSRPVVLAPPRGSGYGLQAPGTQADLTPAP